MNLTKDLNRYYRKIKENMPCSSKEAEKLISPLKESISLYRSSRNNITIENIMKTFGSPEEIAEGYLDSLDKDEYKQKIYTKKRNKIIIIFTILAIAGAIIALYVSTYIYVKNNTVTFYEGYMEEEFI